MRVLIAGGTGLIGGALAASLIGDGHEVCVLSRSVRHSGNARSRITYAQWDGVSPAGWESALADADVVINLTGANLAGGPWTTGRKRTILDSRVLAGKAIAAGFLAAEHKPGVLIQGSAIGYYGAHGADEVTESSPAGSDFLARVCVEWEVSTEPVEQMGVRRVVVRSGLVLSPDGGMLPKVAIPFRLFGGGPVGSGDQFMSWIHIEDEVSAIRHLIDHTEAHGAYNLAAPNPVTNYEFGARLGRTLGRPNLLPKPEFAMRLILGEMAEMLLTGQRALPARLTEGGYQFRYPVLADALGDIYGRPS